MTQILTIEQELRLSSAVSQLVRMDFAAPVNDFLSAGNALRIDLCMTPRLAGAEARFTNHWPSTRFEPLGQVFIVPPGEILQFRAPPGRQVSVVCQLEPELLDQWFGGLAWTDRRLLAGLDIGNARIATLLRYLAHELRYRGIGRTEAVEAMVRQIAIELVRHLSAIEEAATIGGLAGWRLNLIDGRLGEPGSAPTLIELAEICNMSVRQLTRGFRISRGYSIGEYVAQHRMDLARRLLTTGESIKAIANQLGFASPSSFSFAFRRATGVSPRLFRARVLRGI